MHPWFALRDPLLVSLKGLFTNSFNLIVYPAEPVGSYYEIQISCKRAIYVGCNILILK